MKRIISCYASDFQKNISREDLKHSIIASEGRVIMAQTAANNECLINGITNAELISSFGTDMILLKMLDVEKPFINGLEQSKNIIQDLKRLTGRLIGINLEVIGDNKLQYDGPTVLSDSTLEKAISLKPDFLCLTAYRNKPGNSSEAVLEALKLTRSKYDGLLILNKYASIFEIEEDKWEEYVKCGADVITLPMPGSSSGVYVENISKIASNIKKNGGIVSMSLCTSQEGADTDTIKFIAIQAKQAGADIFDFGDANSNGIASPENIMALSIAVRGKRHTYFRIAASINR